MNITLNITQRKDIMTFVLLLVLAFFIGYNVIYKSRLNKINSIGSQIEEEKKKSEALEIIAALERRLQAYQKRSFSTTEITQLVDKISELAKRAGIEIETFNPKQAISRKQYIELSLEVPLRCNYHKLGKLLSLIESNQELIWVKKLNIQKPAASGPTEARIPRIDLTVSGLYLKK
jgi:Tfp pilus assembly protein PilO